MLHHGIYFCHNACIMFIWFHQDMLAVLLQITQQTEIAQQILLLHLIPRYHSDSPPTARSRITTQSDVKDEQLLKRQERKMNE